MLVPNAKNILSLLQKAARGPQIIMPKDAALILAYTGIGPGSKVVDAGTGSGFLAIFLANYVRPGRVVTYENDKRSVKIANCNIESSGLSKFIRLREADVTKGIKEKNADLVALDLKYAKKVVPHAHRALKPGGWLAVYSPNVEQLVEVKRAIEKKSFCGIKTVENIVREWKVERTTRPKTLGIMHTGFLTFAQKAK
jgi:tRNA (adenine57-N1/adenine58-N1)-methyltransferase